MKKLFVSIFVSLFLVSSCYAGQGCPLKGNSYIITPSGGVSYELTDFGCDFGPGCEGYCSLWYGDFERGPLQRIPLDFSCIAPEDASPDSVAITIATIPCFLDANNTRLTCIPISMDNYREVHLSNRTFIVPKDTKLIRFKKE